MIAATQGKEHFAWVTGPLGERVKACWACPATASPRLLRWRQPAVWGSFRPTDVTRSSPPLPRGTGGLILQALEHGAERIIIGIGGSATNDGGAGMMRALGARLCDAEGQESRPWQWAI